MIRKITGKLGISRNLGFVTVGNFAASAIGGVMWIILASLFNAEEYGQLSYAVSVASLASSVALIGMNTTVITLLAKDIKSIKNEASFIILISNVIAATTVFAFVPSVEIALLILALSFFNMSTAELLGTKNFKIFMTLLVMQKGSQIGLAIILGFLFGVTGAIIGFLISYFIFSYKFFKAAFSLKLQPTEIRRNVKFIMHSYAMEVTRSIDTTSDKILIAPLFGFSILGVYQLSVQFLMLLSVIPTIIYHYMLPNEAGGIKNRTLERFGIIFSMVIAIISIISVPTVINTMFPTFRDAILPSQIMLAGIIPMTISSILNSKFLGNKNSAPVFVAALIFLATQYLSIYFLGNAYGILGLAFAMLLALSIESTFLIIATILKQGMKASV